MPKFHCGQITTYGGRNLRGECGSDLMFVYRVATFAIVIGRGVASRSGFKRATEISHRFECDHEGQGTREGSGAIWWPPYPPALWWVEGGCMAGFLSLDELFKGRHFDREIIVLCVRWYLRFKLSFRDLVEMMAERHLSMAHTTMMRRVHHYAIMFRNSSVAGTGSHGRQGLRGGWTRRT